MPPSQTSRPVAVISDNRFGDTSIERSVLEPLGVELLDAQSMDGEAGRKAMEEADALLVNLMPITAGILQRLKRCKVIARYGVGMDNIDCQAARALGIQVLNVPDYCGEDVAQHTLALALALLRDLPARNAAVHQGRWNLPRDQYSFENRTVGVLGFGSSGRAFCRLVLAMRPARLLVYSPNNKQERMQGELGALAALMGVELLEASREEVLCSSDLVSIHLRLSDESHALINSASLKRMRPGVFIINTARGAIIDSQALREALDTGQVAGAALDVLDQEPPQAGHPLLGHPSVVFSDHCAYRSVHSLRRLRQRTAENAARGLGLLP